MTPAAESGLALLLLGAGHGVNPGMGWLLAAALGLQQRTGRAVWRALPPLALGHAGAIGLAALVAVLAGITLPPDVTRWLVAVLLVAVGGWRFVRSRHPRVGGMTMTPRELTLWSFLMATAHGAGLMALPFLLTTSGTVAAHAHHAHGAPQAGAALGGLTATAVHTAGYLVVTMLLAWLVYARVGVRVLRTAWINLDLLWAAALVLTGVATALP